MLGTVSQNVDLSVKFLFHEMKSKCKTITKSFPFLS